MNEKKQLKTSSTSKFQIIEEKPTWQKPMIIMVGKLRDIVQGGGKTGGGTDQEGAKAPGIG